MKVESKAVAGCGRRELAYCQSSLLVTVSQVNAITCAIAIAIMDIGCVRHVFFMSDVNGEWLSHVDGLGFSQLKRHAVLPTHLDASRFDV